LALSAAVGSWLVSFGIPKHELYIVNNNYGFIKSFSKLGA
jgi:hypothetical protein